MVICQACGGTTIWVDDVSSDVCEQCGTLSNPSQVVLESHIETASSTFQRDVLPWVKNGPPILKNSRAGNGVWIVSGQDHKVIYSNREEASMRETIQILTSKLNCPREFNRSFLLFTQAMSAGSFRWGKKAACVAGICISIALREAKRPDSLREIALELSLRYPDITYHSLTRTYHSVISAIGLESSSADPASYLTQLRHHIEASLHSPSSPCAQPSLKAIKNISLSATVDLASSLCSFLSTLPEDHEFKNLPAGPTACACFLHAIEGVLRSELPSLGSIAQFLGSKWGFSQKSVQNRYRSIQDVLLLEIDKTPGLGGGDRGKRKKVNRNLKEVLQYRDLIADEVPLKRRSEDMDTPETQPATKKRAPARPVTAARKFLLDPLANPITSASRIHRRTPGQAPPLCQELMARPESTLPPTRLQMLSLERGGSTEDVIYDSELFAEGELDEMLRGPEQMEVMMRMDLYKEWEEAHRKSAMKEQEISSHDTLPAELLGMRELSVFSDREEELGLALYSDFDPWDGMSLLNEKGSNWEDDSYNNDQTNVYQDQEW